MPFTYWYIATPYSKYPAGHEAAYIAACRLTAELRKLRVPCYSPIAESHGIALYGDINPTDHQFWVDADKPMLDAASGLLVIKMESWEVSKGIQHEIEEHAKAGKPIIEWDPATAIPITEINEKMAPSGREPFKRWASGAESPWKRWSEESER
jgi:hypothetical protein